MLYRTSPEMNVIFVEFLQVTAKGGCKEIDPLTIMEQNSPVVLQNSIFTEPPSGCEMLGWATSLPYSCYSSLD